MSQVHEMPIPAIPLKEYLSLDHIKQQDIFVVKGPLKKEVYTKKTFPKETHYNKESESEFIDYIEEYEITDVIRSTNKLKTNDKIWIWTPEFYGIDQVQKYHESGESESPIVTEHEPIYPISGKIKIVILSKHKSVNPSYSEVFIISRAEGVKGHSEIKKIINDIK